MDWGRGDFLSVSLSEWKLGGTGAGWAGWGWAALARTMWFGPGRGNALAGAESGGPPLTGSGQASTPDRSPGQAGSGRSGARRGRHDRKCDMKTGLAILLATLAAPALPAGAGAARPPRPIRTGRYATIGRCRAARNACRISPRSSRPKSPRFDRVPARPRPAAPRRALPRGRARRLRRPADPARRAPARSQVQPARRPANSKERPITEAIRPFYGVAPRLLCFYRTPSTSN